MKILKRISTVLISLILLLMLTFNIYNYVNIKILHHDLAPIGSYAFLEVVSGSMEPTINVGDIIVIKVKNFNYQENDIVTFYDVDSSFVTHRIVKLENDKMVTKGDHNNTEDEALPQSNIVGKYLFKLNKLGFKNPIISLLILIIGILVCYLLSFDNNTKEDEKQDKELQEEEKKNIIKEEKNEISQDEAIKRKKKRKKKKHKKRKRKNK